MANVKRARGDTAVRLLRVISILERNHQGLTVARLHHLLTQENIACSERTVRRDLEVISSAHLPLISTEETEERQAIYTFKTTMALMSHVHFTYDEILALYLAKETLRSMTGSPLIEHILKLVDKIEKALGPGVTKELSNLSEYVSYKANSTWRAGVSQEILDTVYTATYEKQKLEIEYKSQSGANKDRVTKRVVGPETLYFANGGAYLIAQDFDDKKVKFFALARLVSVSLLEDEYKSAGFVLEDFVRDNFGIMGVGEKEEVELFIEDPLAAYVSERRWHESQRLTRVENGIRFYLSVKLNDELARWILGLGPAAKVIKPERLRDQVLTLAQGVSGNYSGMKKAA